MIISILRNDNTKAFVLSSLMVKMIKVIGTKELKLGSKSSSKLMDVQNVEMEVVFWYFNRQE